LEREVAQWRAIALSAGLALLAVGGARGETPQGRGAYLVTTIVACGNCHTPKDKVGIAIPGMELAGGLEFDDGRLGHVVVGREGTSEQHYSTPQPNHAMPTYRKLEQFLDDISPPPVSARHRQDPLSRAEKSRFAVVRCPSLVPFIVHTPAPSRASSPSAKARLLLPSATWRC
jgi:hypothetical protein